MARRKSGDLDAADWLEFHGSRRGRTYLLDALPEAAALVRQMLAAIDGPVSWQRVARYVRERHPDAPRDRTSYQNWAHARIGETR